MNTFSFIIISLLTFHWLFDFTIQTEQQGMNKSKNIQMLFSHVNEYSIGMFIWCFLLLYLVSNQMLASLYIGLKFWLITFICHFLTDYITSKFTSNRYKIQKFYGWNGFWFWIGLDQLLHSVQLLITFYFIV